MAVLEGIRGKVALDRSAAAVKGHWWQTVANWGVLSFLGATPGIMVALLLMVLARLPLDAANSVASLVYAVAQPLAIAGVALLYLTWSRQSSVVRDEWRGSSRLASFRLTTDD